MSTTDNCPVCEAPNSTLWPDPTGRDALLVKCVHCGAFALSRTLLASLSNLLARSADSRPRLSHALRRAQESNARPLFGTSQAEASIAALLPRPREQADLLLRWLADHAPGPGELLEIDYPRHGALIGSKSHAGFRLIVEHLIDDGLVIGEPTSFIDGSFKAHVTPSFAGWDRYEQLQTGQVSYRRAFMAMKFGDAVLDRVLSEVFRPSAMRAGFQLLKLNDVPKAGLIDNRLRVEVQSSDFVIADLSHDNLGAYWEAGYAEGLGKPVIYTCERQKFQQTRTHFDTNHHLTILWDAESPHDCGEELTATIRATLPQISTLEDSPPTTDAKVE